jgi:hypothetical protein
MPRKVKPQQEEKPKLKMPRQILHLGQWTIPEIMGLPDDERLQKLIDIDEQLPGEIRAKLYILDVAEMLGLNRNTVNTYINMHRLVPDGERGGVRNDRFFYPATILRYILAKRERERKRAAKQAAAETAAVED